MTRTEAATFLGQRLGAYLSAVSRTAEDSAGNLAPVIDDALRALGYAEVDLATADPTEDEAGYRLQLMYRALLQIVYDLAVFINVGTAGESFSLQAIRQAAEKDLERAEKAVRLEFGTLGVVSADGDLFATLDTNINVDPWCWEVA